MSRPMFGCLQRDTASISRRSRSTLPVITTLSASSSPDGCLTRKVFLKLPLPMLLSSANPRLAQISCATVSSGSVPDALIPPANHSYGLCGEPWLDGGGDCWSGQQDMNHAAEGRAQAHVAAQKLWGVAGSPHGSA